MKIEDSVSKDRRKVMYDVIKLPQLKTGDVVEIDGYKGIVIDVVQDRRKFFEKFKEWKE